MNDKVTNYLRKGYAAVPGMSSLFSARIILRLIFDQAGMGIHGHVAEIGVYKGRLFIALALALAEGERAIGIDKFSIDGLETDFTDNLRANGVTDDRIAVIVGDTLDFDYAAFDRHVSGAAIRFFHVDGNHTQKNLTQDLHIAARRLREAGIICVDDMQHPCYPLLGRAVDQFLAERPELRVFCVIDREDIVASGKYLICRHDHVERYAKRLEAAFRKHKFHRADFGSYHALLLTPNPKPIQY